MRITPPHSRGTRKWVDVCLRRAAVSSVAGLGALDPFEKSRTDTRASFAARQPLAMKPKWRMRWKPSGRVCRRKRRDELVGDELHDLAGAVLAIILPGESADVIVFDGGQAARWQWRRGVYSDRDRRAPGRPHLKALLCIDDPVDAAHVRDEG